MDDLRFDTAVSKYVTENLRFSSARAHLSRAPALPCGKLESFAGKTEMTGDVSVRPSDRPLDKRERQEADLKTNSLYKSISGR